ncbi:HAMP domain-containing protein [Micrococcales bacterium 31B]|nr:HAMP domain-containing protein [Micrococcales bacterium 31B]
MRTETQSWWRSKSLRARILTTTAGATALALVAMVLAYVVLTHAALTSSSTTAAETQVRQVAGILEESDESPAGALNDIPTRGSILQILDASGAVVASNDAAARAPLTELRPGVGEVQSDRTETTPNGLGEPYAVAAMGFHHAKSNANFVAVLATPLQGELALLQGATIILSSIGAVLLVGLVFLVARVLRSAFGSMEQVRASVAEISATDLSVRVPVSPAGDEVSRLADTMNGMLDRLQRADVTQRSFVSNASHELRSPITALRAMLEVAPEGLSAAATRTALGETQRLELLVYDLLTLAKADDRGLTANPQRVDAEDLIWDEVFYLQTITDHQVSGDVGPGCVLFADTEHVRHMLRNLADNAARHAVSTVRFEARRGGEHCIVTVDNDGAPVPEDLRDHIFERFVRLDESRQRDSGGSGLGLAIVKALAEVNGGRIRADVAPDGWCRFELAIPVTGASGAAGATGASNIADAPVAD